MKLEYDKEVDAAYIYLEYPLKKGQAKRNGLKHIIHNFVNPHM